MCASTHLCEKSFELSDSFLPCEHVVLFKVMEYA